MGLLRPATPLALILFVAFVLLLLATLSTPIIPAIPLGSWEGVHLGVFGWCNAAGKCSKFQIGYGTEQAFAGSSNTDGFELPVSTRHSLTTILIVHPIAALLALICFGLAVAAHFHAPSHSPRYLLGLLILTIPTLLVTLLAFLVDILVFVPHVAWGGWIVLAATILIVASSVVTCAMRRTLVSRKARKKRIAENADMNGQNYYENLGRVNQTRLMADELPRADSPPPMSGSTAVEMQKQGGVAQFATFEMKRQNTHSGDSGDGTTPPATNDDRAPLNPMRDPSIRSASTGRAPRPYGAENAPPPMPIGGRTSVDSNGVPRRPSRDPYGNAVSPIGMAAADLPPGALRHQGSRGSLGSDRSNGYRGRGGYGPPGRGYGPPRGGYGPPRGGYGPPRGGFRGQGPPPPGWRGRGGPRGGGMVPRPGPPPPGYGAPPPDAYFNGPRSPTGMRGTSPAMGGPPPPPQHDEFIAGPGPIGQAIEMNERTGNSPARSPTGHNTSPYGLRDSDGDVMGMVGLQQGRGTPPVRRESERSDGIRSPTSVYSDNTYIPPRAGWQQSPIDHDSHSSVPISSSAGVPSSNALPLSPIQASPRSHHARGGSDAYYEDVDPRFAVDPGSEIGSAANRESGIPGALTPGAQYHQRMPPHHHHPQDPSYLQPPHLPGAQDRSNIPSYVSGSTGDQGVSGGSASGESVGGVGMETDKDLSSASLNNTPLHQELPGNHHNAAIIPTIINRSDNNVTPPEAALDHAYDALPTGARSPGEGSEASHFTSISQRPVNPNWRPGYGPPPPGAGPGGAGMSSASAVQRRRDEIVLNANPDFSLPGMAPGGRRGGPMRGPRGGAGMGTGSLGLTPGGRYPTDL